MSRLAELSALGQAIWLDYIRRHLITSGGLQEMVDAGVTGVTSNPSIFEKAIAGSSDYDGAIERLAAQGKTVEEIYEDLTVEDIVNACDILRPVYEATSGGDGYVSLEVNPGLARDTQGTVDEAKRLFAAVDRPNLMIKVPATPEGIPAIEMLTAVGVNVNATLIFSAAAYESVAQAYMDGVQSHCKAGGDPARIGSVASFFVSRVDTAVDAKLEALGEKDLLGKIAVANAKVAYARFKELLGGDAWRPLAAKGAMAQRPLWASTGTKNAAYSDILYVDELIGPHTVNTLPPSTLNAFLDHGTPAPTLESGLDEARHALERLDGLGIALDEVTDRLLEEGVNAFAKSFDTLMAVIAEKREQLSAGRDPVRAHLGSKAEAVETKLGELALDEVTNRIWAHDHTVWRTEPADISNRLGWLETPERMAGNLDSIAAMVAQVRNEGYTHALLLGMGGSSLAPEVIRKSFGVAEGYLDLSVLDSTDPDAVLAHAERLDPAKSLFVVSSKSGTTVEPLSFFKYFHESVARAMGADRTGEHFIAITDPGSKLAGMADSLRFRATFLNDPNIGGRYSALSYFGMVPAALVGADPRLLLDRAKTMACSCGGFGCPTMEDNPGARLGVILGTLAAQGTDKLTIFLSPQIQSLGDWVEQLIAESTGKEGRGILPVVGERPGDARVYGPDRLFVHVHLEGDRTHDSHVATLKGAGFPVVVLPIDDAYDLGAQFFLWEMATSVAGHIMGIHPFDQPDVESAKVLAREMVASYRERGKIEDDEPAGAEARSLRRFLSGGREGDYIAIQAYLPPTPKNSSSLDAIRTWIRDEYRLATTVGYGPRYLHSTGQLHKGDGGNGLFLQLTCENAADAPIPDKAGSPESTISFGVLKASQAIGDRRALSRAGRRVLHFHLGRDAAGDLRRLLDAL
jgi:transaldolase/glucose-6-phosphate isomerase